jgi:hypothetical protein
MKVKLILAVLCLALAPLGIASADPADDATAHVYVDVDPNIAVAPAAVSVDLGGVQVGPFGGDIRFRVDANTQQCKFYAVVSHLYKGDDCTNTTVPPIFVSVPEGVIMDAENANPTGGHPDVAVYIGPLKQGTCFDGYRTEEVTFESSQNNHFSQYFSLRPTWLQDDPEKPMGEYSGFVSLWASVVI